MTKDQKLQNVVDKCIDEAQLTVEDLEIANAIPSSTLIENHGWHVAERVFYHLKHEFYRLRAQNQFTPLEGFQDRQIPYTRTAPLPEGVRRRR